jgi:hypothetical protein
MAHEIAHERPQRREKPTAAVPREGGRDPDMVQSAVFVIEAEEEGARKWLFDEPAEAADDAIGGSFALDLDHLATARPIRLRRELRDDAVDPGVLLEPHERRVAVAGDRREVERGLRIGEELGEKPAPLRERALTKVVGSERDEIERDEPGRRLPAEPLHPRLRRMQTCEQRDKSKPRCVATTTSPSIAAGTRS